MGELGTQVGVAWLVTVPIFTVLEAALWVGGCGIVGGCGMVPIFPVSTVLEEEMAALRVGGWRTVGGCFTVGGQSMLERFPETRLAL